MPIVEAQEKGSRRRETLNCRETDVFWAFVKDSVNKGERELIGAPTVLEVFCELGKCKKMVVLIRN